MTVVRPCVYRIKNEGGSVSWGGAQTKYEGHECGLIKNMFFHSDFLQLCLKKMEDH